MKSLNYFLPVLVFVFISLLFCYPQLKGKILSQSDNIQWKCMAHEAMAYHDSTGKDVLWSNNMDGGMPTYTTYIGAKSTNYPGYLQSALQIIGKPAYFFFIYMLGFYLLMLALGVDIWAAAIGAFAYAFATFNVVIVMAGHETQALTLGYLPAALAGLFLIFHQKRLYGSALLALSLCLMAGNNHFQILFYSLIVFLCFALGMLGEAIRTKQLKAYFISCLVALSTALLALGPNITSILTTQEYASSTIRGGKSELAIHDKKKNGGLDKETAFLWSGGPTESFVSMIPYLYGGASYEGADKAPRSAALVNGDDKMFPVYWGPQPLLLGPVYFGAVICFLFVLGALLVKKPFKWWILFACAIGYMLSWGKNFQTLNYFLFDHVPPINMFRAVTMSKVIPQLLFPFLGILGLQTLLQRKETDKDLLWKNVKIAGAITIGICIILGIGGQFFFNFTNTTDGGYQPELLKALKDDRASLSMQSCFKSAFFIAVTCAAIWGFLKNKLKAVTLLVTIAVVVAVDLIPVANDYLSEKNYVDEADYNANFEPRDVDKQILRDTDPYYRVLDLSDNPFTSSKAAYFHKCVGGNNPAIMEKYNDLIQRQMINGFNTEVINMLNTKYFIVKNDKGIPFVQVNDKACGNAWFVAEVKWVDNDEEAMQALKAGHLGDTTRVPDAWNPKKTAVIRTKFKEKLGTYNCGKDTTSAIKLDKYGLDDISFVSTNKQDGLGVFSDIYYSKGWKAYVDGKETPIVKADYVLRCIKIPAGNHKIEFHFRPDSFYKSQPIATGSSILILLLCAGALVTGIKAKIPMRK